MPQHRFSLALIAVLLGVAACDSSGPNADLGRPDTTGTDSTPPPDTTGTDTTLTPPVDSGPPTPPPSDSLPPYDPTYIGIPFGPAQQPPETFNRDFNGTILSGNPETLIADLEMARRS